MIQSKFTAFTDESFVKKLTTSAYAKSSNFLGFLSYLAESLWDDSWDTCLQNGS